MAVNYYYTILQTFVTACGGPRRIVFLLRRFSTGGEKSKEKGRRGKGKRSFLNFLFPPFRMLCSKPSLFFTAFAPEPDGDARIMMKTIKVKSVSKRRVARQSTTEMTAFSRLGRFSPFWTNRKLPGEKKEES